jgi:hypothetical protein
VAVVLYLTEISERAAELMAAEAAAAAGGAGGAGGAGASGALLAPPAALAAPEAEEPARSEDGEDAPIVATTFEAALLGGEAAAALGAELPEVDSAAAEDAPA